MIDIAELLCGFWYCSLIVSFFLSFGFLKSFYFVSVEASVPSALGLCSVSSPSTELQNSITVNISVFPFENSLLLSLLTHVPASLAAALPA